MPELRAAKQPPGRRILAALLAACAVAGIALGLLNLKVDTSTESFLPSGDPSLAAVQQKARAFGGDPIVVLLRTHQPGQALLDHNQLVSLLGLEGRLAKTGDVAAVYGPATVLNQVATSAQGMLAQIAGRRDAVKRTADAEARKQGKPDAAAASSANDAVAQFDARYGALLVQALPAGLPTLNNPQFVRAVAFDGATGQVRPQWSFVVPTPDTVAISVRPREGLDQVGTQHLTSQVRQAVEQAQLPLRDVTISGVPTVTAGLAHEIAREMPLIGGIVALAVTVRFLLVPVGLRLRHRLWPLLAAALGTAGTVAAFGLLGAPLSFGAVAFLPILLGVGSSIPLYLAILQERRRVITMSLASAAGFAALAVSPLPFVAELGLALAGGVVLTVAVSLLLRRPLGGGTAHPGADPERGGGDGEVASETSAQASTGVPRAPAPPRRRAAIAAALAALAALGWIALPTLDVHANPEQLAQGLPELQSAQRVQQAMGSSGEVNVALRGPNVSSPAALDWSTRAEEAIIAKHGDQLRPVLTPPDLLRFLGGDPTPAQISSALALLPKYLTSAVINPSNDSSVMIFGLKLGDVGQQAALLDDVRASLPPPPPGLHADLVGLPVAAQRGYELISGGRYLANIAGIATAGVVLWAGLRRRSDTWRAMLAAILATGWGLAGIWLLGGSLSPLTVALGSLTSVTGCEFAILLATPSVARSRQLRRSVTYACLTSAVGFLALAASDLAVLRDFGIVLATTVMLSYAAARATLWIAPPAPRTGATTHDAQQPTAATYAGRAR